MKALKAVAESQAEVGDVGLLAPIAHATIGFKSLRAEALAAIGEAHAKAGDDAAAQSTFAAALAIARGMEIKEARDEADRLSALTRIAAALARAGNFAAALRVAEEVTVSFLRESLLGEIVAAQAHAGELDEAFETVRMIDEGWVKAKALRDVAVAQVQAGLVSQAVQTAEKIIGDRGKHLHEIGTALAEEGDWESFKRLLIPCSFYPEASYRMCGVLVRLYPGQATAIAQIVQDDRGRRKEETSRTPVNCCAAHFLQSRHLVGDAAPQHRPALVHEAGEEGVCLVVGDSLLVVDAAARREVTNRSGRRFGHVAREVDTKGARWRDDGGACNGSVPQVTIGSGGPYGKSICHQRQRRSIQRYGRRTDG